MYRNISSIKKLIYSRFTSQKNENHSLISIQFISRFINNQIYANGIFSHTNFYI